MRQGTVLRVPPVRSRPFGWVPLGQPGACRTCPGVEGKGERTTRGGIKDIPGLREK